MCGAQSEDEGDLEQGDEAQFKEPGFKLHTWARATQHAAVIVDHPIGQGEDIEWTLAIYDLLDMEWPWKPLEGEGAEDNVDDEKGQHFEGLFIGVTHKPIAMPPKIFDSTICGIRARDGQVLHRGNKIAQELTKGEFMPIQKHAGQPAILHLRLDRRPMLSGHDKDKPSYADQQTYASRLWMQRVGVDTEAKVLMDSFGFKHGRDVYPVLYANYPVHDISHAVKFRGGGRVTEDVRPGETKTPRLLPEDSLWKRADSSVGHKLSWKHSPTEIYGLTPRGSMPPSRRSISPMNKSSQLAADRSPPMRLKQLNLDNSLSQAQNE